MRKGLETERILIIMEYADAGDLSMVVKRQRELKQYLPESDILSWFVQIALGLQYIHKKNILHRDLKTQNIFVTSKKLVKIGDFGISKWLSHTLDLATTAIGTPHYLSPEICRRQPYSHKSDMWSLGNNSSVMSQSNHTSTLILISNCPQVAYYTSCAPCSWLFPPRTSFLWLHRLSGLTLRTIIHAGWKVFN